jgi:bifunctional UDP-N-acetylglucosamine pyrophosphorylase/glucosamine-1-phosphate N-acetyltransferase
MRSGVTMIDPERTYIDSTVTLAADVTLFPGVVLQGSTTVDDHAEIGPDTRLVDCHVGEGAIIEHTVARRAEIGAGANVGPYAVLHPGDHVAPGTVTGPFFTSEG